MVDAQSHGLGVPTLVPQKTKYRDISDDFGVKKPRHSENILAKKCYDTPLS